MTQLKANNRKLMYNHLVITLTMIISGFLLLNSYAVAGPNELASCSIDLNYNTQEIESILQKIQGNEIIITIIAENVSNLDTFQVEVNYDETALVFVDAYENYGFDENFLSVNGGQTIGLKATKKEKGLINLANALKGTDKNIAPEGTGIIAYLVFNLIKCGAQTTISLSNVHFQDSDSINDTIVHMNNGIINVKYPGDIDGNCRLDLRDAIDILKFASGF